MIRRGCRGWPKIYFMRLFWNRVVVNCKNSVLKMHCHMVQSVWLSGHWFGRRKRPVLTWSPSLNNWPWQPSTAYRTWSENQWPISIILNNITNNKMAFINLIISAWINLIFPLVIIPERDKTDNNNNKDILIAMFEWLILHFKHGIWQQWQQQQWWWNFSLLKNSETGGQQCCHGLKIESWEASKSHLL